MSKTIKLADATYYRLQDYTRKGETYDDAITRLLSLDKQVKKLATPAPLPLSQRGTKGDLEESKDGKEAKP